MKNLAIILLLLPARFVGQNMVPNNGFENASCTLQPILNCLDFWSEYSGDQNLAMNTADICYELNAFFPLLSIPPYEGTNCAAMECSVINPEYVQVKLTAPMEAGAAYCVSFYTSAYTFPTNLLTKLGAYFSSTPLTVNPYTAGLQSHINNTTETDSTQWLRVSDVYIATGGEQYMTIGGFQYTMPTLSYMYVDLVEVYKIPQSTVNLGPDQQICPGQSITLNAGNDGSAYLWSTGETTAQITVFTTDTFWVQKYFGACYLTDTVVVTYYSNVLELGEDKQLCQDETIVLDAGAQANFTYLWNTGQTTPEIEVEAPGLYWVVKENNGCSFTDSVSIFQSDCIEGTLYMPNSFTPNGDGLNDAFGASYIGITEFELQIFNRWGQIIFETANIIQFWDGYYQNTPAPADIYIYKIKYKNGNKQRSAVGKVALVR